MALAEFEPTDDDAVVVSKVRTFVADELRRLGRPDRVDDAVLVASELASNAVLHGRGVAEARVEAVEGGVRIEVYDRKRLPPMLARASVDAMTGRGLRMVSSLSARWAVEPTDEGKVVWAELSDRARAASEGADEILDAWHDEEWDDPDAAAVRHRISLGDVPTTLLLASKSHADNLVREFTLAARGARSGVTGAVPPHLASLIETVATRFAEPRQAIKRQALAAESRGHAHVRLELTLPQEAADAGVAYLRALDEADAYCRAARLLTLETPPQHRVFRRWYVGAIIDQLRAASAGLPAPPPETFEERLLREIDAVAAAQEASSRAARLYEVSAALARAHTPEAVAAAVLDQGVAALGASGGGLLLAGEADRLLVLEGEGSSRAVAERIRSRSGDTELPAAVALRSGEPVWLESGHEESAGPAHPRQAAASVCAVPLEVDGRRLGALRFSFPEPRLFDDDERRFVLALAAQAAQTLDRAQLHEQRVDLARRLQGNLLSEHLRGPSGVDLAGVYLPSGDGMSLGGSFCDAWPLGDGRWALAVADAVATGPEAAALAAMVRFSLRALTVTDADPRSLLHSLNAMLLDAAAGGPEGERCATALFGVLSLDPAPTVALATAGNPPPVVRRADGRLEEVPVTGSVLGQRADPRFGSITVELGEDDTLVVYAEGVRRPLTAGASSFGAGGLRGVLRTAQSGARAVSDAMTRAALHHEGSTDDRLAALVVHCAP